MLWLLLIVPCLVALAVWKLHSRPPVWYDDLAPKDFNREDVWWNQE